MVAADDGADIEVPQELHEKYDEIVAKLPAKKQPAPANRHKKRFIPAFAYALAAAAVICTTLCLTLSPQKEEERFGGGIGKIHGDSVTFEYIVSEHDVLTPEWEYEKVLCSEHLLVNTDELLFDYILFIMPSSDLGIYIVFSDKYEAPFSTLFNEPTIEKGSTDYYEYSYIIYSVTAHAKIEYGGYTYYLNYYSPETPEAIIDLISGLTPKS